MIFAGKISVAKREQKFEIFVHVFSAKFCRKTSRGSEMAAGADLIASQVGPTKTIILFLGSTNLIEGPRVPKCNQEVTVGR